MRRIMRGVADNKPLDEWMSNTEAPPAHRMHALLDWLAQEGYLQLADPLDKTFVVTERGQQMLDRWSDADT
jgi:hypothetical protein